MHSASFAFSASVRQLLVPLAAGASVLLAEAKHLRDPEALLALAAIGEATIIDSVPSYLSALAATLRSLPASRAAVARGPLRYVLSTGEPLPTGVAASLAEALPRARVVNLYGQTETCGSVSALVFDAADHAGGAQVPIGPAIGETVLAVLDEHDAPVPPGGAGELCVLGPSLAIEYFGRPELTEARFVASPLAEHGGARLYRTGDLVRPLPGGLALHVGRRDHQVKVNGIRVDLGEVEAAIRALPGIDEVAVTARDEPTGAQLIAYVVAGGDADADRAPLRAALAERLPEHMLPSRFVPLPALPRTSSGKVDRPAVPWPLAEAEARAAGAPPTSGRVQLAAAVAEVFAEVLGRPVTDVGSDFFELGGDSMQATHAVVRLRESLPLGVSWMSVFFENPSPMAIAEALETESDPELLSTWMTRVRSDH
jgi:aspartate racemase